MRFIGLQIGLSQGNSDFIGDQVPQTCKITIINITNPPTISRCDLHNYMKKSREDTNNTSLNHYTAGKVINMGEWGTR